MKKENRQTPIKKNNKKTPKKIDKQKEKKKNNFKHNKNRLINNVFDDSNFIYKETMFYSVDDNDEERRMLKMIEKNDGTITFLLDPEF